MNTDLQKLYDLFIQNRAVLREHMSWETQANQVAILGSYLYTAKGKTADAERYERCKQLLKNSVGVFSAFRGYARAMVISKMALSDDPEGYLKGSLEIYGKLRELHKLTASPFMVMAAMTLYENGGTAHADENIKLLEDLYRKEKDIHPILINDYDRGYLAMIVTAFNNVDEVSHEIESCYEAAKDLCATKDPVHSLAQILTFSGLPVERKVSLVRSIVDQLEAKGHPIRKRTTLPAIGALTILNMAVDTMVEEIVEIADRLKQEKGFRWLYADAKDRVMYAALLVFIHHTGVDQPALTDNISATMVMTLIEQMVTLVICTCAGASAAAASSSSSH